MMIVLDVSAAVNIVLYKANSIPFTKLIKDADEVLVPELYFYEAVNIFWKFYHFKHVPQSQCETALMDVIALPDTFVSGQDLYLEVYHLSCLTKMPAYDLFYAVLARRYNAVFLTMDIRLKEVCQQHDIRVA